MFSRTGQKFVKKGSMHFDNCFLTMYAAKIDLIFLKTFRKSTLKFLVQIFQGLFEILVCISSTKCFFHIPNITIQFIRIIKAVIVSITFPNLGYTKSNALAFEMVFGTLQKRQKRSPVWYWKNWFLSGCCRSGHSGSSDG